MLLDLIVSVLSKANPLQTHPSVWVVVLTMGVLGMLLIIWRLWRFTLLPAWYPREPKELPYWIPSELLYYVFPAHGVLYQSMQCKHIKTPISYYTLPL